MPIVLGGALLLAFGAWLVSRGSGDGGVVRRVPPGAAGRQANGPGRVMPATPGRDEGAQHALEEAARIADRTRRPPTSAPTGPSHDDSHDAHPDAPPPPRTPDTSVTHLEIDPPTRPPAPRPTTGPISAAQAISRSADPTNVHAAAESLLTTLRDPRTTPATRSMDVTAFQRAYGQGLTADGDYGRRTRRALHLILGVPESNLPAPS